MKLKIYLYSLEWGFLQKELVCWQIDTNTLFINLLPFDFPKSKSGYKAPTTAATTPTPTLPVIQGKIYLYSLEWGFLQKELVCWQIGQKKVSQ